MDDPGTFDTNGNMDPNTNNPNYAGQIDSNLSEDDSRRLILESYEKAGVDLPLVTLETILDREISEDDVRQTGAPRFRKFLNKASSAMANRGLNTGDELEEGPDDEVDEIGADALSLPSTTSYTSNFNTEYEAPQEKLAQPHDPTEIPQTPTRSDNMTADGAAVIPPTPDSMQNDCHAAFDFCCPKSTDASPAKYVMSNLQLPEGFEDEQQSVDAQEQRAVPALMDTEDSTMMDESSYKIENEGQILKGNNGVMSFFRGSQRFRLAVLFCCLLNIILIGLIIAFVTNRDNESFQAGSASASMPQGQTATTTPATDTGTGFVTSKTLFPAPELEQGLDLDLDAIVNNTSDASGIVNGTASSNTAIEVVQEDQLPVVAEDVSAESCDDLLEVDTDCVGEDSELFVRFVSCTPQPGDWVAIFDSSVDAQSLLDSESIGWLYTCGDRFCEEAIEQQTLSFTRAKERAEEGTYRAHLIREGLGPIFSSIASSAEFRIVTGATDSC